MINQRNEKGQVHGYWEVYWYNGQLDYKGSYKNGLRNGYWEWYHYNGKLFEKQFYII